jgi:hypothetical protein
VTEEGKSTGLTDAQIEALKNLCDRYGVEFRESDYTRAFDLPNGWVNGWVGGIECRTQEWNEIAQAWVRRDPRVHKLTIFVGCDPEGRISS